MDEAKKEERRRLLAELEGSWDTVDPVPQAPESVQPPASGGDRRAPIPSLDVQAALDAAADRLVDSLHPPPVSSPMLAAPESERELEELDSGWGGEGEDEEDDEDEPPESEPELPDEKLFPVAYAEAKIEQAARLEARRERKRVRVEMKKAKRRARAEAAKSKQKGKTKKARSTATTQAAKLAQAKARGPEAIAKSRPKGLVTRAELEAADAAAAAAATGKKTRSREARGASESREARALAESETETPAARKASSPSKLAKKSFWSATNVWMLGIAFVVFVAAAIFAAVLAR